MKIHRHQSYALSAVLLVLTLLLATVQTQAIPRTANLTADEALTLWTAESARYPYFKLKRQARIDSIKELRHSTPDSLMPRLYHQIGRQYSNFNVDSAIHYYRHAMAGADPLWVPVVDMEMRRELAAAGHIREALDFKPLSSCPAMADSARRYMLLAAEYSLYVCLAEYTDTTYQSIATGRLNAMATDSVLSLIGEDTPLYALLDERRCHNAGKVEMALGACMSGLRVANTNDPLYWMLSMEAANNSLEIENPLNWMRYIINGSLNGIERGDTYGVMEIMLCRVMYEFGEPELAHRVLTGVLEGAITSGAVMQARAAARDFYNLNDLYVRRSERFKLWLYVVSATLLLLLAALAAAWFVRRRRRARASIAEVDSSASPAPEEGTPRSERLNLEEQRYYAVEYLNLCCHYIERLEAFQRLAKRKISAGQTDDLYHMLSSGNMDVGKNKQFCQMFDNLFLRCFPNFITDINLLLRPECQIDDLPEGKLNNELRIFAFMRLGIDDTQRISQFLGVSVNTIYTYRNKIRSRAIDRNNFEEKVSRIG